MGKSNISVSMQIEDFQKLMDEVAQLKDQGRKAIRSTVRDVKSRGPGWIAQEVIDVYNIKKGEIVPQKGSKPKRMAGHIQIKGEVIEDIAFTYIGRLLTPVYFGMTPKSPPPGKSYTLKMQVIKGQKKVIGRYRRTRTPGGPFSEKSHNILMSTGNTSVGGINYIPFQRVSRNRNDIRKFTAISMPQMVTSDQTREKIIEKFQQETTKRLQHYLERALQK